MTTNGRISQLAAAAALVGDELVEVSQLSAAVTITATTISAQASDNSLNDSAAGFVAAGFTVGKAVKIVSAANSILSCVITAVTAGKLTFGGTDGDVIVDAAAGGEVTITQWGSVRTTVQDVAALGGSSSPFPVFDLATYATVSGSYYAGWQTAMSALEAAGRGIIQLPAGVIDIDGPLQDIFGANAQLLLPSIHAMNGEQITVIIRGVSPPPTTFSVIGDTPLPDNHSVIRSTLATGSGGNLLGCSGPVGTFENFSLVNVVLKDVTFRMPANPAHSAVDLSRVVGCSVDNVVCDTGSYWVQGLTQPATATSYGIKFPKNNNGADTRIGCINVIGFYTGALISEHTNAQQMNFWGCLRALESSALAHHASHIKRLMTVHCPSGVVASGSTHFLDIEQFDIEHAASGWWALVYDVDDPSNLLRGRLRWHVVKAGVGLDHTFLVNGGAGLFTSELGYGDGTRAVAVTGSRGLWPTDAGKLLQCTNAGAMTYTVEPDSTVMCPEGTEIHLRQANAGSVTIVAGTGVTIQKPASQTMLIKEQFGVVTLKKMGTNSWMLFGMLGAV